MTFTKTKIKGLYIIEPKVKTDGRGNFIRIFCKEKLSKIGVSFNIIQVNLSTTFKKGTIRGMHFQKAPTSEDKIVRCLKGKIYDVVIDLRKGSPTYGKWSAEILTEDNKKMLLIPKGFAHGFQTLTDSCELLYFMSKSYSLEHASGVCWNDPYFKIVWPIKNPTLSEKDKNWPLVKK